MSWKNRVKSKVPSLRDLLATVSKAKTVVELNSNKESEITLGGTKFKFRKLIGLGVHDDVVFRSDTGVSALRTWLSTANDVVLGYLSYDLKNLLEDLTQSSEDSIGFPQFHFFIPKTVIIESDDEVLVFQHSSIDKNEQSVIKIQTNSIPQKKAIDRADYISAINELKEHIQQGDIYEVNYCVQHGFGGMALKPYRVYQELQVASPAPFSCFVADSGKYLMSSSPERFMQKIGSRIISQPIKGTNRRLPENEAQKDALRNDAKEVAENVMITDLVRNDLSKTAKPGSVRVDELCGIYEFEHVNQMISTISSELREDVHPLDAILQAFPMGSMTGAPKIRAMQLIDEYEDFSRGLYSGAVGYFTPDLDFDFNVVIRSILYNEEKKVVTFPTGGAITINSDPQKEYEECMLKAEAMRKVLLKHAK